MALQVGSKSTAAKSSQKEEESIDDFHETAFFSRDCCFDWSFPCQSENWERISTSEREQEQQQPETSSRSWFSKGIKTLKKAREWSEIVAGPKWKTFIRRFNKTSTRSKSGKFQYDPTSYALNFDDGLGQNGQFEDDCFIRNFSSRYAAIPGQNGQLASLT